MNENEIVTLNMSISDLSTISEAMERQLVENQLEFQKLEQRAMLLKNNIEKQAQMLSIMKAKLGS